MLNDDELFREIIEYLRYNPNVFPISSVMIKFGITEDKAKEVLNRVLLSDEL